MREGLYGEESDNAHIEYCYNHGNITSAKYVGGIAGCGQYGTKANCYNAGAINGTREYVGGIAGTNGNHFGGTITKSNYNIGIVSTTSGHTGAILGWSGYRPNISNNYYIEGTADYGVSSTYNGGSGSNTGTIAVSAEELKQKSTSLGKEYWKDDIYHINSGYPILAWQTDNDNLNLINGDNAFVEDTEGINNGYPLLAWQVNN